MKPFSTPIRDQCELRSATFRSSFVHRNSNLAHSYPFVVALRGHRYVAAPLTLGPSASCSSRNPDPLITDRCPTDISLQSCSVHTLFTLHSHCSRYFLRGEGGGMPSATSLCRHVTSRASVTRNSCLFVVLLPPASTRKTRKYTPVHGPVYEKYTMFMRSYTKYTQKNISSRGRPQTSDLVLGKALHPSLFRVLSRSFRFFPHPLPPGDSPKLCRQLRRKLCRVPRHPRSALCSNSAVRSPKWFPTSPRRLLIGVHWCPFVVSLALFRNSDFGFLSDFGIRFSDLHSYSPKPIQANVSVRPFFGGFQHEEPVYVISRMLMKHG